MSQDPSDWLPAWFPASYDLATEVHFFLKDYQQACPGYHTVCIAVAHAVAPCYIAQHSIPYGACQDAIVLETYFCQAAMCMHTH